MIVPAKSDEFAGISLRNARFCPSGWGTLLKRWLARL